MSVPNVVMNSLVSATKVITNDTIPNPIVATLNPISLPTISLPVMSIGVPIMNLKTEHDGQTKSDGKGDNDLDADCIEAEDEKLSDTKKSDELMPVEDDTIIEMAHKIEENIAETDVEVTEALEPIDILSENVKSEDCLTIDQSLNRCDELNSSGDPLNSSEPMECASVNSMASPKHTMTTDVIMAESVSVRVLNDIFNNIILFCHALKLKYSCYPFQTSSTGSMQVESSDTSLTSNTDMHDIVEKYAMIFRLKSKNTLFNNFHFFFRM